VKIGKILSSNLIESLKNNKKDLMNVGGNNIKTFRRLS
jgi:hypothetical protein